MNGTITARQLVTHPYFSITCFLTLTFFLPQFGGIAVMVACAGLLSVLVMVSPEQYRDRSGSMTVAISLVTALWVGAAIISFLILSGAIQG